MDNSQQELGGKGSHRSFDFNSNDDDKLAFVNFPSQFDFAFQTWPFVIMLVDFVK